ncbi:SAICAR synthase-like protein [Phlebopus sp. FC_14]|nr:SAICAR synthase-like protein [Phlebopus sp. FC_14]
MAATTLAVPPITTQTSTAPVPSPVYDNSQRNSLVSSSGASYFTARASPLTPTSPSSLSGSSRSSAHTLTGHVSNDHGEENLNQIRSYGKQVISQEVHFVKVTGDTLELDPGQVSSSVFQTVGGTIKHVVPADRLNGNASFGTADPVGPPPPSPPASVEHEQEEEPLDMPTPMKFSNSEPVSRPITFEDPIIDRVRDFPGGRDRRGSVDSRETQRPFPCSPPSSFAKPSGALRDIHRSSTDTRASMISARMGASSVPRATRVSAQSDGSAITLDTPLTEASGVSQSLKYAQQSADGYLQPPQTITHRPARRNTTGSNTHTVRSAPQPGHPYEDGDIEDDILIQAEQIRRERKRKAQIEAEGQLTRTTSRRSKDDENKVLVGNLIGEDHVNYVLMYNMLTGIRIAVSRCQAKIKRPLTDEDFTARHKYSFDIVGNELTPSAKYDFKFKDYAPWVFRELREDYFQLDPADYLLSLTAKYILSELGSPGKSGSFFYFSRDYRFIIKTIRHSEHKFLLSILKQYHAHVKNNPHTLLSRFYGLHRVKLPRGRKIHFVIMNNLFPPHKDIHETFDLKGSTVGREYPEDKAKKNPRAVLKDLNWINRGRMLELGPEKRALLTEQLRRDSELLKKVHVMDYSLLVGIHYIQRGNRDNVRSNTLKVVSPSVPAIRRKNTQLKGSRSPEAIAMRKAMRKSDLKRLGSESLDLPEEDTGERQHFIFYQDEGGLQATDEANDPMDTLYYVGVIDILTPYSSVKKVEHLWKGLSADRHKISPVPPHEYADRFFAFMKAVMRGGGGGGRFKSE